MEPGCFMASIDLSNAYYRLPMHSEYTKYLKFKVDNQMYKYLALPQGFKYSPRISNKIFRPILSHFRKRKLISSLYIDDLYLQGAIYEECLTNVNYTTSALGNLGFEISEKSVCVPTQTLSHLGFSLDSIHMTVTLDNDKRQHIEQMIQSALDSRTLLTVRALAKLIGTFVASFPAVEYGPLHYRSLEILKIRSLQVSYEYDKLLTLSNESIDDLKWWPNMGIHNGKFLYHGHPTVIIKTDPSGYGWGAIRGDTSTYGLWSYLESLDHINVLELKAAMLGIQALCKDVHDCFVQVQIDNNTAVAYINNMGGTHSLKYNHYTRGLLLWCVKRKIWITACHIAGSNNSADYYSRKDTSHTEWMLNLNIFQSLCKSLVCLKSTYLRLGQITNSVSTFHYNLIHKL